MSPTIKSEEEILRFFISALQKTLSLLGAEC